MQRKTAPSMLREWKWGLSERMVSCCSTGRENIDWLVCRQSVGWLVGWSVWVWRVPRQLWSSDCRQSLHSSDFTALTVSCGSTSVFSCTSYQALIDHDDMSSLCTSRLCGYIVLHGSCSQSQRLQCLHHGQEIFWPIKTSIPGNSFFKVAIIYDRTVNTLVKGL